MIQKISFTVCLGRNSFETKKGYLVHIEAYQSGRKVYFSTKIHLQKNQFCHGLVVNHPLADRYNAYLYRLRNEIESIELEMITRGRRCTLAILKAAWKESVSIDVPLRTFAESVMESSDRCEHTKQSYRSTIRSVEDFHGDCCLQDINYDWLCRFWSFLRSHGLAHNTMVNKMRNIRCLINEAVKRKLMSNDDNPFNEYRIPSMTSRTGYLDYRDLRRLQSLRLDGYESVVRDSFLFACYTGLRFSDLLTLRSEHVQGDWIVKGMVKTGDVVRIPYKALFRGAAAGILARYDNVECLSRIGHNSQANRTLRNIAARAGITRRCTYHLARHTCGTLLLREGVPITTVQMILGHRKLDTTKGYAEVDDLTIRKDVRRAFK